MAWVYLVIAGFFEIGFALGLKYSEGFSRFWPTVGMAVAGGISFYLLSIAMKSLPVGTAYAVWTGIGAAGTVVLGILFLKESSDLIRLISITLIIVGVVGLRFSSPA
ncbi:MAG: QacE family quaternary ammonium compound efflux SMR transporter [Actinobacteria bacterium]|nr:multidrug efflux SMR transporter [Actinomycetota bacterium]PLS85980.1 MAG: QacE family quaternary ammonium compound efflux SMR transporter [Actinomycetota bacterium]